jgi:hypothetical protein
LKSNSERRVNKRVQVHHQPLFVKKSTESLAVVSIKASDLS